VGQLTVNAIGARYVGRFLDFRWLLQGAKWELTCGFCKEHFTATAWSDYGAMECPDCGTRNLLLMPRFAWDPGPRPRHDRDSPK
jgi:DNA-directed RNA polymerase subunit RPC12/RpoP